MTEAIINLETVNPIEFFGINNSKFEILKRKFPLLKLLSRGTQIKISGQPDEVTAAQAKINQVIQYLERNGHLSENYFSKILGDEEQDDTATEEAKDNDILVFGPNGRVVRAKTQNQKLMAQATWMLWSPSVEREGGPSAGVDPLRKLVEPVYAGALYLLAFACAVPSMVCLVFLPKPEEAPAVARQRRA